MVIELSERTVARLTVLAEQRGVTPAVIAEELVTAGLPDAGLITGPRRRVRRSCRQSDRGS